MTDAAVSFGYKLPNCGGVICRPEWARPEIIDRLALTAIDSGFNSLWLHDHLVTPAELKHLPEPHFYEPLVLAAKLASTYSTATIGVATLVLPLREPVLTAKQLTTLEALFPGRFVAGVGVGRYESEFVSAGSSKFRERGRVTDEYIDLIIALAAGHAGSFEGKYRSVTDVGFFPRPGHLGRPPIWVGGMSGAALRRAARVGEGWIPAAVDPPTLREKVQELEDLLERSKKDPTEFRIGMSLTIDGPDTRPEPDNTELHTHKLTVTGSEDEVKSKLADYVSAGATDLLISFSGQEVGDVEASLRWFGNEILPEVSQ